MCYGSTIHVVDDDPAVCDSLQMLFVSEGYTVITYNCARTFLHNLPSVGEKGCVITDFDMPWVNGFDLLDALKVRRPYLPVLIASGHYTNPLAAEATKRGAVNFFKKPLDCEALLASVHEATRCKNGICPLKALGNL